MSYDHTEHFEPGIRNTTDEPRRIDRAKTIRDERQCSVQEAVAVEQLEFLTRQVKAANSLENIKAIIQTLLNKQFCGTYRSPSPDGDERVKEIERERQIRELLIKALIVATGASEEAIREAPLTTAIRFRQGSKQLAEAITEYARDLRRNSSGGDDYPWEIMKGVADYLDVLVKRNSLGEGMTATVTNGEHF